MSAGGATLRRVWAAGVLGVLALGVAGAWRAPRVHPGAGGEPVAQAQPGAIRMLSSETCVVCAIARGWFEAHHVSYRECLIERDTACRREFEAGGWTGTPVILVRGKPLLGFSPPLVQAALAGTG